MRIEVLSIGDWVVVKLAKWGYDSPEETEPMRIRCIDNSDRKRAYTDLEFGGGQYSTSAHIEDLRPIPHTPEILEKNGFVKAELATVIEWYHWRDIFIGFKDGLIYTSINGREIWGMRHVHQLQHTLRLAGIDKEIEV